MTSEEIKKSWFDGTPIKYSGTKYKKITALIYRLGERREMKMSVELLDENSNSVTIATADEVCFVD